ncbi:MAG TPA: hypothetical protein VIK90_01725, partial [Limnochordales bacterium]
MWHAGRVRRVARVALVVLGLTWGAAASAPGQAQLEAVLEQARRATRLVEGEARVRQIYRVSWLGRVWQFDAWVHKGADAIQVRTVGAPWFIPREMSLALVEAFDLLEGYEPSLEGTRRTPEGHEVWVVRAVPRQPG